AFSTCRQKAWGSQSWLQPALSRPFRGHLRRKKPPGKGGCGQDCPPHHQRSQSPNRVGFVKGASSIFTANQVTVAESRNPVNLLRPTRIRSTTATTNGATAVMTLRYGRTDPIWVTNQKLWWLLQTDNTIVR